MKHETESEFIKHVACDECGSSDANSLYTDGHTFCFSCGKHCKGEWEEEDAPVDAPRADKGINFIRGEITALRARNITADTCRKYGYTVGKYKDKTVQIANYYSGSWLVAQKLRTPDKKFKVVGDGKKMPLFGQHLFKPGGRKVVVTEGEVDCLTVSQLQGNKWPVVSLPNGAQGAKRAMMANMEWLSSFETIVLMFDSDEAGRKAAQECAPLFKPGQACIAELPGKDPNELMLAGKGDEVIAAMWNAAPWKPDGVLCGEDLRDVINQEVSWGLSYPWADVTAATYGARVNEIVTLGAGTGMGKTEFFKEIATHFLMEHKQNIGLVFLEEAVRDTALGIMGKHANVPFHIPDSNAPPAVKEKAFQETIGTGRAFFYDHFGYTDYDTIKQRIRYMVVACGCRWIFLDHVTALVSGFDGDERRELDRIMTDLASLVRELNFGLFMISHLATPEGKPHEEGGRVQIRHFRGSRAIGQWSSFMFALERDQQADDPKAAGTTTFRILKDRYTGRSTGFKTWFTYDTNTGRLIEAENPDAGDFADTDVTDGF